MPRHPGHAGDTTTGCCGECRCATPKTKRHKEPCDAEPRLLWLGSRKAFQNMSPSRFFARDPPVKPANHSRGTVGKGHTPGLPRLHRHIPNTGCTRGQAAFTPSQKPVSCISYKGDQHPSEGSHSCMCGVLPLCLCTCNRFSRRRARALQLPQLLLSGEAVRSSSCGVAGSDCFSSAPWRGHPPP